MTFTEYQVRQALKAQLVPELLEENIIDTLKALANDMADHPACPTCGGRMWDNRISKRNPKAPDFKCRDRNCDGVIWPPRGS